MESRVAEERLRFIAGPNTGEDATKRLPVNPEVVSGNATAMRLAGGGVVTTVLSFRTACAAGINVNVQLLAIAEDAIANVFGGSLDPGRNRRGQRKCCRVSISRPMKIGQRKIA